MKGVGSQLIALFNFKPSYCPSCGADIRLPGLAADDYFNAHCACTCLRCGLSFAHVEDAGLIEAATRAGGDLGRYAR